MKRIRYKFLTGFLPEEDFKKLLKYGKFETTGKFKKWELEIREDIDDFREIERIVEEYGHSVEREELEKFPIYSISARRIRTPEVRKRVREIVDQLERNGIKYHIKVYDPHEVQIISEREIEIRDSGVNVTYSGFKSREKLFSNKGETLYLFGQVEREYDLRRRKWRLLCPECRREVKINKGEEIQCSRCGLYLRY